MKYAVVYEQAPRNWSAYVPDLPGCIATGRTRTEVPRRIRGAIGLHLYALRARGADVPETSAAVAVIASPEWGQPPVTSDLAVAAADQRAMGLEPGRLLSFISRWAISDRRGLLQGCERLLNCEQDGGLEGAQGSARADCDHCRCHRDVIRRLPQVVPVVIAERIPEAVQLSTDRFDVLGGRRSAVLGVLDELRPGLWRVAEPGQVERHRSVES